MKVSTFTTDTRTCAPQSLVLVASYGLSGFTHAANGQLGLEIGYKPGSYRAQPSNKLVIADLPSGGLTWSQMTSVSSSPLASWVHKMTFPSWLAS